MPACEASSCAEATRPCGASTAGRWASPRADGKNARARVSEKQSRRRGVGMTRSFAKPAGRSSLQAEGVAGGRSEREDRFRAPFLGAPACLRSATERSRVACVCGSLVRASCERSFPLRVGSTEPESRASKTRPNRRLARPVCSLLDYEHACSRRQLLSGASDRECCARAFRIGRGIAAGGGTSAPCRQAAAPRFHLAAGCRHAAVERARAAGGALFARAGGEGGPRPATRDLAPAAASLPPSAPCLPRW